MASPLRRAISRARSPVPASPPQSLQSATDALIPPAPTRQNVHVTVRIRPPNATELSRGETEVFDIDSAGHVSVNAGFMERNRKPQTEFNFDAVYSGSDNILLFERSVRETVKATMEGYNGTVFAYGQTGSGKTFTMMGADIDNEDLKGLIPRIVEQIFNDILTSPPHMEYTVKVSYMEIYMERIRDLLNPQNDNLPIHEEKNRGVYVKGLMEVYVSSVQEVYEVMRRGGQARVVAYTNMNAESSRSHSIFVITINQKNLQDGSVKSGKLSLVDLAGSEKVGKTGASGQTLEEAKKINKSLSALGMVINALTDGKSTHIPYRDSKLTRILQESLGGNSRTTLIINCSPSSFNEAETLSTLRFGMRAKSIKNKAKVNAELSPAELKALLRKAKSEAVTFQQYIAALEGEIGVWRSGGTVAKEKWISMDKVAKGAAPPSANPAIEAAKREEMGGDSRPTTPAPVLEKDERDELLQRENDLTDQIEKKESELAKQEKLLGELREELSMYKEQELTIKQQNTEMTAELSELKRELEKLSYDNKEGNITIDMLRENYDEAQEELVTLKKQLVELRSAQKEGDKEQKKQAKMAEMLAELDPNGVISQQEQQILDTLAKFDSIDSDGRATLTVEELASIRSRLSDAEALIRQHEITIAELNRENEHLTRKRDEAEIRLTTLELEYEELLDKTIAEEEANNQADMSETISELRSKLESQYAAKKEVQQKEIDELRQELEKKNEELHKLNSDLSDMKRANEGLEHSIKDRENRSEMRKDVAEKEKDMERIRKTMAQQLADFDVMKKALMRDLQNRCEKVVELEISLDETREQYNSILRNSNSKQQQKKMAFLERNLEQLTNVQKQLVEQNSSLKKEVAIAERKLLARNERIQALEALLQDAQEKLTSQNQKFEQQLQTVRARLEQARSQKTANSFGGFSFGRIAKPVRGGGMPNQNVNGYGPH